MSRPAASSRPPAASPRWNVTQTNSSNSQAFHVLHRPANASSTLSRPQTAAPRLQRPVTAKSPFLSYDTLASPNTATATATATSTPVPFSLLDSITTHRASKGRGTTSASTRPASAYGRRERHTADFDQLLLDDDADGTSAAVESTQQPQQQWKVRERRRQDREEQLGKHEERKEADDNRNQDAHITRHPTDAVVFAASTAATAVAAGDRVPPSVAALCTYAPQSFQQSPGLQQFIQLLHAAPLLASFLPSLASLDTTWSSLIASHSLYRQSESRQMAALRDEELRIRDAMLTFMRVSMEYRRTDVHDAADGRIVKQGDNSEARLDEAAEDGWLVRDDGQRTSIEVDWNGRYWHSERSREKEAWYRAEERELQSLYESGVQLVTQLYRHKFELLMRLAADQRTAARGNAQTQQLNTQLHETLTALRLQSTKTAAPSSAVQPSSATALLPPRHPSLSTYAGRLYTSLNELSTLLSSHYQQVVQVVDHSHTLTAASVSIDQLVRSLHEEERERREEVEQLKHDRREQRDEHKRREAEWEDKLRLERLETYKERELRSRVEAQAAELKDTLARIQAKYEADWKRRHSVADKDTQCEVAETPVGDKSAGETQEAEDDSAKVAAAHKLLAARVKTKSAAASAARSSGKHNFQLNLTTPTAGNTASDRLSPRSSTSPRSASNRTPPPVTPQSRSPRSSRNSVFTFGTTGSSGSGDTSASAPSSIRNAIDGGGKMMRPAVRGGAIADGAARHSKAVSSTSAGTTDPTQTSSDGKTPTSATGDRRRWDGVPFV